MAGTPVPVVPEGVVHNFSTVPGALLVVVAAPREVTAVLDGFRSSGLTALPEGRPGGGSPDRGALRPWRMTELFAESEPPPGSTGGPDGPGVSPAGRIFVVESGVGSAAAAGAAAWALGGGLRSDWPSEDPHDEPRDEPRGDPCCDSSGSGEQVLARPAVLSLGIGGALPSVQNGQNGQNGDAVADFLDLGAVVRADRSVFADTGLGLPQGGFKSMGAAGFPLAGDGLDEVRVDVGFGRWLDAAMNSDSRASSEPDGCASGAFAGGVASVATCSASDVLASAVAERTGARVEAMEGASVGVVAQRFGCRFAELRVVSNTTGDRERQVWDLDLAFARLGWVAQAIGRPWCEGVAAT